MRMRSTVAKVALLAAGLLPGCTAYELRGYGGFTSTKLSGDVGLSPSGNLIPPVTADVESAFGLGDAEGSVYLRAEAALASLRLTASAFQHDESGNGTLNVNFGDLTIGTPVASTLDLTSAKVALSFDVLNLGVFRLSPGVALDYFDIDTTVRATTVNAFETVDVSAPVPMPFLQLEGDLGVVAATLDAGWIHIDLEDAGGTFFDLEALVRVQPFAHAEVFAGYRFLSIDADGDADGQDFRADLRLQGWMIGGGITF
jgi:hypothetical protein